MFYKYIDISIDELWERTEEFCQREAEDGILNSKEATGKVPKEAVISRNKKVKLFS